MPDFYSMCLKIIVVVDVFLVYFYVKNYISSQLLIQHKSFIFSSRGNYNLMIFKYTVDDYTKELFHCEVMFLLWGYTQKGNHI